MMNLTDTLIGQVIPTDQLLQKNKERREKATSLIPTDRDEYITGDGIMKEIMGRKRARFAEAKANKLAHYQERFGLTFSEIQETYGETGGMSDLEWRRSIKDGKIKGDFAGEDMSFPITSPDDVRRAWGSIGRTKQNRDNVMRNIIKIAKKFGWESGLPDSVKKRLKAGESGLPE